MSDFTVTSAQYTQNDNSENTAVLATIDGVQVSVPMDNANRHYDEIMRQVDAGTLTIADAD